MADPVIIDRMTITPEVFGVLDAGGCIKIIPGEYFAEENQPEPPHAELLDQDGSFIDWLF